MKFKDFNVTVHTPSGESVSVTQKTTALPEYPPEDPVQGNIISTYIASQIGSQFSIVTENHTQSDASVVFYVDGQMACCLLCYKNNGSVVCAGVQPQAGLLRKFVFRKATLTGITPPQKDWILIVR